MPEYLINDLIQHLIELTAGDEEYEKRFQAIRDTCSKDANTDQVSGYTKLLEAVSGDYSVIVTVNQEFGKLGYHFNDDSHARKGYKSNEREYEEPEETPNLATILLNIIEQEIVELFQIVDYHLQLQVHE